MRMLILTAMVLACYTANADVFKCVGKAGKTVYQEKPCQAAVKEQQLDIKADPVKEAEAKARLESIQMEVDTRRAERLQVEKDAAIQRNQVDQVEALRRSAFAEQQQAVAQQRQAEALERQNQQVNSPYWVMPGYPTRPRSPGLNDDIGRDRDLKRRNPQSDRSFRPPSSLGRPDMR